jgi:hypothetical protein
MPEQPCPQCGRVTADEELLCPHCGVAQIPQVSKERLRAELRAAREGPSRAWPAVGCAAGLLVGIVVAWLFSLWGPNDPGDWTRSRTQAEIVFLLMIGGLIGGLIVRVLRTTGRQRYNRDDRTAER